MREPTDGWPQLFRGRLRRFSERADPASDHGILCARNRLEKKANLIVQKRTGPQVKINCRQKGADAFNRSLYSTKRRNVNTAF